jgi:DNA-binding transcriptional ArsR family regulator
MKQSKTLFEMQSEVCKTLASAKRLEIINALKEGEKTVGELVEIERDTPVATRRGKYLLSHRQPEGGTGLHPDARSTHRTDEGTVETYRLLVRELILFFPPPYPSLFLHPHL